MIRRILVGTGNRADYSPLSALLHELHHRTDVELQLLATGTHLAAPEGTRHLIERDGYHVDAEVEMLLASDSPVGVSKSLALCVAGAAEAYARLRPHLVVILGDRYEALGLAQAAMIADVPIAHIGGGESTDGVADEAIRHSITKMAHLHFVAAEAFRRRVIQLGEDPRRVWTVGALGLDTLTQVQLLSRAQLAAELDAELVEPVILLTYHPTPRGTLDPEAAITVVLKALDAFPDATILATQPNVDAGGSAVVAALDAYAATKPERVRVFPSLGQLRYLSALRHADVVVGNSSSGLIEAPALQTPTVNVGIRQRGRLRAASVIDCAEDAQAIADAIADALSPDFRRAVSDVVSPYGDGHAVPQITALLTDPDLDPHALLTKPFFDMPLPTHIRQEG